MELKGMIMRNRTGISLSTALLFVLTTVPVAITAADSGSQRDRATRRHATTQSFDVSGEFTGTLDGEIQLGGVWYRLAADAILYEIGSGLLPSGTMVVDRHVFLSGMGSEDTGSITMVIVCPEEQRSGRSSPRLHTRLEDDASSQ
jgi:hypothetical protein